MRTIEEVLEYIDDKIESENELMKEFKKLKISQNSPGYGMTIGSRDALFFLKEFITEKED